MARNERIVAVVVSYFPEEEKLRSNLQTLTELGLRVVLYDNTPFRNSTDSLASIRRDPDIKGVVFQGTGENIGLSRAYNKVVKEYLDDPGIDGFLFLDQDSFLLRDSLIRLFDSFYMIRETGWLGVIGGNPLKADDEPYGFKIEEHNVYVEGCHTTRMVPSSFSIVPNEAFRKVGLFHDDFFIDHIDMDFCFRLRRSGLLVLFDAKATFPHSVGCGNIILFGRYITPVSSPFRHYFQVRNSILSYRRAGYRFFDMIKEICKRIAVILLQSLLKGSFVDRCRYACRGLLDGIRGRGGGIPPNLSKDGR